MILGWSKAHRLSPRGTGKGPTVPGGATQWKAAPDLATRQDAEPQHWALVSPGRPRSKRVSSP